MSRIEANIKEGRRVVREIMSAKAASFKNLTPAKLPEDSGVYAILDKRGRVLRAGKAVRQGLRDRIYRNHLMGSQKGNLRAQLVLSKRCGDMKQAKKWIRSNCSVKFLEKSQLEKLGIELKWAEYFLLAALRPEFTS